MQLHFHEVQEQANPADGGREVTDREDARGTFWHAASALYLDLSNG